jgi:hypothetical protein
VRRLASGFTYHFRLVAANAAGTTSGVDARFALAWAPRLSHLRLSPSRFQARTTISYDDWARARTTFTVEHCVGRRRCTVLGRFRHTDHPGINRPRFSGRLAGKPLAPGRYTIVAVAAAGATTSRPARARFEVT